MKQKINSKNKQIKAIKTEVEGKTDRKKERKKKK